MINWNSMELEVMHRFLFASYLSDIKQYLQCRGYNSDTKNVECGVPHESFLGPLLFIIYTNYLPNCLASCKAILFADDTTVYLSSHDVNYLYTAMNRDLSTLIDWFRANTLSLNITKTNCMLFTHKNPVNKTEMSMW